MNGNFLVLLFTPGIPLPLFGVSFSWCQCIYWCHPPTVMGAKSSARGSFKHLRNSWALQLFMIKPIARTLLFMCQFDFNFIITIKTRSWWLPISKPERALVLDLLMLDFDCFDSKIKVYLVVYVAIGSGPNCFWCFMKIKCIWKGEIVLRCKVQ